MPGPVPLHDGWTLRPVGGVVPAEVTAAGPVPATVPGTVHTDLLAAGLIPDPYLDDNERTLAWIGLADWRYERTVTWSPDGADRVELVFAGLDTVALVELNGEPVAATANMHRTYRLEVGERLRPGDNTLAVTFTSALRHADRASLELGARPHVNPHPYNAVRKMACNFGWDWGPDLVTAGIWRPVALHAWRTARLASVRPVATVDGDRGTVEVHVAVERAAEAALAVTASVAGVRGTVHLGAGETAATVRLEVPGVRRWWPRGRGDQPLYDVEVTLDAGADAAGPADSGGDRLDGWAGRVGFRTVRLVTEPDEHGTSCAFEVNGERVFVRGANWIPDDAFPHRVTRERYAARLAQAEEANLNLVRVWGGGIFEADDFYAECDERGILVWQDFLFACAAYAEEEPMRSEVEAEVRDNVSRLVPHPSLVLWNGGNENLWGHEDWGWKGRLDGKTWGAGYYGGLLPALVAELDPGRPYVPGSPWSPGEGRHPNDPAHGAMHIWDVWNQRDYPAYREHRPRFVSEFGWQGPATWATLRRAVSDDPLTPESPGMLVHQKAMEGHAKLTDGLVPHLPAPDEMHDWHWAMSLNQARAIRTGVEHFRSLSPVCAGSVVWQLNDCWPVTSWAAVDGDGRRKPLFYALRHAHADRLLTVQPRPGGLAAVLVNDTAQDVTGPLSVSRRTYGGKVLAEAELPVSVAARGTAAVDLPAELAEPDDAAAEVLVVTGGGTRALWFFAEDRDSALAEPELAVTVTPAGAGHQVRVAAGTLVRDLALLADKVAPDAVVDDMLVTLLPGEEVVWTVTGTAGADPQQLCHPTVLRSANQLVARWSRR